MRLRLEYLSRVAAVAAILMALHRNPGAREVSSVLVD